VTHPFGRGSGQKQKPLDFLTALYGVFIYLSLSLSPPPPLHHTTSLTSNITILNYHHHHHHHQTMSHPSLPISALPVWAALNSVDLGPTTVRNANSHHQQQHDGNGNGNGNGSSRGLGLFVQRAVSSSSDNSNTAKPVTLLKVPVELVLSSALVDEYAKAEVEFRHLLDAVDRRVSSLLHVPALFFFTTFSSR
jgi:hypothetical protein